MNSVHNMHYIFAALISAIRLDGKSPVRVYKRVEALQFFFIFSKQYSYRIIKKR